jgi:hypothetical protein
MRRDRTVLAPPEPTNDLESVMAVTRANAANGYPWDMALVLVVYGLLRAIGAVRTALRGSPDLVDARPTIISDRHDQEGT